MPRAGRAGRGGWRQSPPRGGARGTGRTGCAESAGSEPPGPRRDRPSRRAQGGLRCPTRGPPRRRLSLPDSPEPRRWCSSGIRLLLPGEKSISFASYSCRYLRQPCGQRGRFREAEGGRPRLCAPLNSAVPPWFPPRRARPFKSRVSSALGVDLLSPNPRARPRPAALWQPAPVRPPKRTFRRPETGGKRGGSPALRGRLRRSSSAPPGALPSAPRGLPRRAPRAPPPPRPAARCGAAARGPRKCRHGVSRAGRRLLRAGPGRAGQTVPSAGAGPGPPPP